ncbi:MAG TPA: hypothetical protein VNH11_11175 [Pirellulales bacterium]|nr:hypothetical protein [Pirellulales bacterium]
MYEMGLGWRAALVGIALAGVLLAAAMRAVLRDSPNVHPKTNAAERRLIGDHDPPSSRAKKRWRAKKRCQEPLLSAEASFLGRPRGRMVDSRPSRRTVRSFQDSLP